MSKKGFKVKEFGTSPISPKHGTPMLSRGGGFNPDAPREAPLTGVVQNSKATAGEERFARMLDKSQKKGLIDRFMFRWTTLRRGTVGFKEADFVIITKSTPMYVSVRGMGFVHRSAASQAQDKINDLIILGALRKLGYNIPATTNVAAEELTTQENTDRVGRRLGLYR